MYLIVGLGNPESEYSGTRHNMGFDVVNLVVKQLDLGFFNYDKRVDAEMIRAKVFGNDCIFLKPQTYMNLSGDSIRRVVNYYRIPEENIIVIYDDMDTEKSQIRIRKNGGSAGHNGVKSVLAVLDNFIRVRVGIGRCLSIDERTKIDYVTAKISDEEKAILREGVVKAADAVIDMLKEDIDIVMNKHNVREKSENKVTKSEENMEEN